MSEPLDLAVPVFCPGGITDTAAHRAVCEHHARQARPPECCGVCPPILRGGYDCTCADNPRCPGPLPAPVVSGEAVERAARATLTPGRNPWSPAFRRRLHNFLAALGLTVTDEEVGS